MKTSNKLALALSALMAMTPLAVAQHGTAPVDLGTLGGTSSSANGVSTADTTVGTANVFGDGYTHAFYTTHGYLQDLESFIGPFGNSTANAISAKGAIAGSSDQNAIDPGTGQPFVTTHAFYFVSSVNGLVDPGTLGGNIAFANGTQNGAIVGGSTIAGDTATVAFLWGKSKGMLSLNTLAGDQGQSGYNSQAFGMNSRGVAVGNSDATDGTTHAVAWAVKTQAIHDLGTLGGSFAQANAVSNPGVVVGFGTNTGDVETHAFTGDLAGHLTDIGTLGGSYAQANAVNDSGVVVGSSNITADADVHAFVWTQTGGMVDLNSLLPSGSPWDLQSANGISPDGTIVGVGLINGEAHAFSW